MFSLTLHTSLSEVTVVNCEMLSGMRAEACFPKILPFSDDLMGRLVFVKSSVSGRGPLEWGNRIEIIHPLVGPQTQPYSSGGDPCARLF